MVSALEVKAVVDMADGWTKTFAFFWYSPVPGALLDLCLLDLLQNGMGCAHQMLKWQERQSGHA